MIKHIYIDVDGCMTDNTVISIYGEEGLRQFNFYDMETIREAVSEGYHVGFLSGSKNPSATHFAYRYSIPYYHAPIDKLAKVIDMLNEDKLPSVAFIGNSEKDDLPLLKRVGVPCCPIDADYEVYKYCENHERGIVSTAPGGSRAVQQIIKEIIHS